MQYAFATINVKNIDESQKFYTEILGLKVAVSFSPQPGVKIAFLKDDAGNTIELIENPNDPRRFEINTALISICFHVKSLEDTMKMLSQKGIAISRGPVDVPGGVKFAYVNDPNGAEIQFIEGFKL